MKKLRVLIVDDEPLARERIRLFLGENPAMEVAGECGDGIEALELIRNGHPDIVFLDVQIPGRDGLQLMAELPPAHRPAIILATAHERFAVEAFTAHAVDYLLKPFDRKRFHDALKRAIDHIDSKQAVGLGARLEEMLATSKVRPAERLAVKADGRVLFLKANEVVWVEAANNYCSLHLANGKHVMVRETLSAIEARLDTSRFARVNRSALVHLDQVQELQAAKYGDHTVVLRNGIRLPLSRSLRGRLGKIVIGAL